MVNDAALVSCTVRLFKRPRLRRPQCDPHPAHHGQSEDFSDFINQGVPSIVSDTLGVHDPKKVAEASQPGGKPLPFNHSSFAPEPGTHVQRPAWKP